MAKVKTACFRCAECGAATAKWHGRCPSCASWNTLAEERVVASPTGPRRGPDAVAPVALVDVGVADGAKVPTGIGELDRVLGGGLVAGSVSLFGGEPGIGKSTLVLQLAAEAAARGRLVLYVAGEESAQQVRLRAERLGALRPRLLVLADADLDHILGAMAELAPDLVVVDSVQTLHDAALASAPGSVGQVRECTHRLVTVAKATNVAVVLVGHVTKEGTLAGPRVLEHVVDTVLSFDGDRHHGLRLLRAVKHRFGATGELGLLEMTEAGLVGVPDASGMFLTDRREGVAGSVVVPTVEGHRPVLVELQTLIVDTSFPSPRRSAQGLDGGRLAFLIAVLERHAGLSLAKADVFALAVGGVTVTEPGADLALVLALASSRTQCAVTSGFVACGEVGLGGEVRQVGRLDRRLAEAARLGFDRAIVPRSAAAGPIGMRLVRVASIAEAIEAAGLAR